jgi:hypothetical protein
MPRTTGKFNIGTAQQTSDFMMIHDRQVMATVLFHHTGGIGKRGRFFNVSRKSRH